MTKLNKAGLELSKLHISNEQTNFISEKTGNEQIKIISLFKKLQELSELGGINTLLVDKIDSTTYTGFSLKNYIASLISPTEKRLIEAIMTYDELAKLKVPGISLDRASLNKQLQKLLEDYRNKLVSNFPEKKAQLDSLIKILEQKVMGTPEGETSCKNKMNTVKNFLDRLDVKKKSEYRDIMTIFSKVCAINPDLGDSSLYDSYLTSYNNLTIQGFLLSAVQCFLYMFQFAARSSDLVFETAQPECKRVDGLIEATRKNLDNASTSNASERTTLTIKKDLLREIYAHHEIKKAFDQDSNWYDVYCRLNKDGFLTIPKAKGMYARKNTFLEKFEEKTDYNPLKGMHDVRIALEKIEGLIDTRSLENQLRKITFENGQTVGEKNSSVFDAIDKIVAEFEKNIGSDVSNNVQKNLVNNLQRTLIKDLQNALTTLKNAKANKYILGPFEKEVNEFVSRHYDSEMGMLIFPELSEQQQSNISGLVIR